MLTLAYRSILHRKTRTFLSVLAIAIEVALLLLLVGLSNGTLNEAGNRIEKIGSDVIVLAPGAQIMFGMNTAVMPLEPVKAALERAEGVRAAVPVVMASANTLGSFGLIFGIEPESYKQIGRGAGFEFVEGKNLAAPFDLVVDSRFAVAKSLKVGQSVRLLNHDFTVSGIVRDGAGVRLYIPIATMQDMLGRLGKASLFFVSMAEGDEAEAVIARMKAQRGLAEYQMIASEKYTEMLGTNAFGIKEFNAAVTMIALTFGFIVICMSMYTTVLEQTRQIGILKSLGADQLFIVTAVVVEACLLCAIGIPAGFGVAEILRLVLLSLYPTLIITFTSDWLINAALLALGSGLLGAIYPAMRASSVDPMVALGYE